MLNKLALILTLALRIQKYENIESVLFKITNAIAYFIANSLHNMPQNHKSTFAYQRACESFGCDDMDVSSFYDKMFKK